mgnify:FL=1
MKTLGIKRRYAGCYEVINHDWPADNGRLEIYQSTLGGYLFWKSCYCDSLFMTLREAKASTFAALENDGLGVTA